MPYPIELNDSQVVIHRKQDAADFCDMIVDQFDEMLAQSERHPLVMNVSVHTYVFGQPFRLRSGCAPRSSTVWATRRRRASGGRGRATLRNFALRLAAGIVPGS